MCFLLVDEHVIRFGSEDGGDVGTECNFILRDNCMYFESVIHFKSISNFDHSRKNLVVIIIIIIMV
jgi:hypothetical protein